MAAAGADLAELESYDWQFAIGELNKAQIEALSAAERAMREKAEAEAASMRQQVLELQGAIARERESCLSEVEQKKAQFEEIEDRIGKLISKRQAEVGGDQEDRRTGELYDVSGPLVLCVCLCV